MMSKVGLLNSVMSVAIKAVFSDVATANTVLNLVPKFMFPPYLIFTAIIHVEALFAVTDADASTRSVVS